MALLEIDPSPWEMTRLTSDSFTIQMTWQEFGGDPKVCVPKIEKPMFLRFANPLTKGPKTVRQVLDYSVPSSLRVGSCLAISSSGSSAFPVALADAKQVTSPRSTSCVPGLYSGPSSDRFPASTSSSNRLQESLRLYPLNPRLLLSAFPLILPALESHCRIPSLPFSH